MKKNTKWIFGLSSLIVGLSMAVVPVMAQEDTRTIETTKTETSVNSPLGNLSLGDLILLESINNNSDLGRLIILEQLLNTMDEDTEVE